MHGLNDLNHDLLNWSADHDDRSLSEAQVIQLMIKRILEDNKNYHPAICDNCRVENTVPNTDYCDFCTPR